MNNSRNSEVRVIMNDFWNEKEVERIIHIGNIMVADHTPGYEGLKIGTKEQQERLLKEWIKDRANAQHDTLLQLISWEIIN